MAQRDESISEMSERGLGDSEWWETCCGWNSDIGTWQRTDNHKATSISTEDEGTRDLMSRRDRKASQDVSKDKKTREKQEWEGHEGLWDATERFSSNLAPLALGQKGDRTISKHRRWSIPCPTAGAKYKMRSSPRWGCCTCPGWAAIVQAPSRPGKYALLTGQRQWDGAIRWDGPGKREAMLLQGQQRFVQSLKKQAKSLGAYDGLWRA